MRQPGAGGAEQEPGDEQDERVQRERQGVHVGSRPCQMWPRTVGSTSVFPSNSRIDREDEPTTARVRRPSSMNGPRMNQFVAPTSFITSISRRREKIESRIVFAISSVEAITSRITAMRKTSEIDLPDRQHALRDRARPTMTPSTSPSCLPAGTRLDAWIVGAADLASRAPACPRPSPSSRPTHPAADSPAAAYAPESVRGSLLLDLASALRLGDEDRRS